MKSVILLLVLSGFASAQDCPGGICPAPTKVAEKLVVGEGKYAWDKITDNQYVLRRDGGIVGQWIVEDGSYYQWMYGKNYGPVKPPIDPPTGGFTANFGLATEAWKINGVHSDKMSNDELITFGGRVIHKTKMSDAFEGKLTDDSSKGYMLIVAKDEAKRASVLQDFMKLPEDFRSRFHLWITSPDHFIMQDRYNGKPRFHTEGDPSVILQNNKGEVLFRRPQAKHVYQQSDMQDLLKSDPNYKPALDPGAPQSPTTTLDAKTTGYIVAAAVVGLLVIRRKNNVVS